MSARRPYSAGGSPLATEAFMIRAPSRWTARPSSRAAPIVAASSSRGHTAPPALRCVCSRTTIPAGWSQSADAAAARTCSGVIRPATPVRPRAIRPECTASPPASKIRMCVRSSAISLRPGPRQDAQRNLVRHRRRRQEERALVAEQLGRAPLELVDGGILLGLFVAELGDGHRSEHLRGGLRRRVRTKVDHRAEPIGQVAG